MVVAEVIVGRRRVIFGLGFVVAVISLLGVLLVVLALCRCGRGGEDLLRSLRRPVVVLVLV